MVSVEIFAAITRLCAVNCFVALSSQPVQAVDRGQALLRRRSSSAACASRFDDRRARCRRCRAGRTAMKTSTIRRTAAGGRSRPPPVAFARGPRASRRADDGAREVLGGGAIGGVADEREIMRGIAAGERRSRRSSTSAMSRSRLADRAACRPWRACAEPPARPRPANGAAPETSARRATAEGRPEAVAGGTDFRIQLRLSDQGDSTTLVRFRRTYRHRASDDPTASTQPQRLGPLHTSTVRSSANRPSPP